MSARRTAPVAAPVVALALAVATTACGPAAAPHIAVSNATVRAPSSPDVTAGYLAIRNDGTKADRLVAVTTPAARQVQIHRMVATGHGMTMRRMKELPIPPHHTVRLDPGRIHLMLMGPHGLHPGQVVHLTLRFATSGTITTTALVDGAGAG